MSQDHISRGYLPKDELIIISQECTKLPYETNKGKKGHEWSNKTVKVQTRPQKVNQDHTRSI